MSADNWRVCPNCEQTLWEKWENEKEQLRKSYGKIPAEKFVEESQRLAEQPEVDESSLREDYEIGIYDDGKFHVNYSGRCQQCGYGFNYKHEQEIPFD